jgi:hypothetical protein
MTPDDRERGDGAEGAEREAGAPGGGVEPLPQPPPTPEEVPELLGERSDYPLPFGPDERGS